MWAIGCILGEVSDGKPLFPGDSEVDQLFIIQKTLGPLTNEFLDMFSINPRFSGLKFPDMSRPETLQKKYVGKLSKRSLNIMKLLLMMEPKERPTAEDCLQHPYFEGLDRKYNQNFVQESLNIPAVATPTAAANTNNTIWPAIKTATNISPTSTANNSSLQFINSIKNKDEDSGNNTDSQKLPTSRQKNRRKDQNSQFDNNRYLLNIFFYFIFYSFFLLFFVFL